MDLFIGRCETAQAGALCFILCGKQLNLPKDLAIFIAKEIWRQRSE
jgi:hypothetical protein